MAKDEISTNDPSTSRGAAPYQSADFETAISSCGFGTFNVLLLCASLMDITTHLFASTAISFVLPSAECDLGLSLNTKGLLNAVPYAGFILGAIPWGYFADTMGRRRVLMYVLLVGGVFVFLQSFVQNVYQLLVFKFIDGLLVSGLFEVMSTYLSEFHCAKHRSRIIMATGMVFSVAFLIPPIIAYLMLPQHLEVKTEYFTIHTWGFFIMCTAMFPLCGGFLHVFFPESPKFLMSQGRNTDAMKCLQTIYALNFRKPKETYPVATLFEENPEKAQRFLEHNTDEYKSYVRTLNFANKMKHVKQKFVESLKQFKPLCGNPYLILSIRVYSLCFCVLFSLNSLRLWMPQIFATTEEYEKKNIGISSMCAILSYAANSTQTAQTERMEGENCEVELTSESYFNNIIVSAILFCGHLLASCYINKLGNNNILKIALASSFISGGLLFYSKSSNMTLISSSIFIAAGSVASTNLISASVNLFPTDMRSLVVILTMASGRFGSIFGNLLFPHLLAMGCIPTFAINGSLILLAIFMAMFLPNSSNVPFQ